jgi:hypothetical protein
MLAQRDLSLGKYYEKRGENRAAMIMYERVANNYSDTSLATDVGDRIASLDGKPAVPPQRAQWLVDVMPKSDASRPLIPAGSKDTVFR